MKYVGLISTCVGVGLVSGPIMGSALYSVFGFKWTFYAYGGFKVVFAILMRLFLPDRPTVVRAETGSDCELMSEKRTEEKRLMEHKEDEELNVGKTKALNGKVSYTKLLCNARFTFAAATRGL